MKAIKILLIAAVMLIATLAQAQNQVGLRYSQIDKLHGFQIYGDEYVNPEVATLISGIDISATSHVGAKRDNIEHWDTRVGYCLPIDGLNVRADYGYLILPDQEAQEVSMTVGLLAGISPRYTISHIEFTDSPSGQVHVVGLDVHLGEPNSISACVSLDAVYNDGFNPLGTEKIQDWTHATAGLVLNVPVGNMALQPACWYQHAFEPDALQCERDEVWWGFGISYAF